MLEDSFLLDVTLPLYEAPYKVLFFFFQQKSIDIFLILPLKHMTLYSVEAHCNGASKEYIQNMV